MRPLSSRMFDQVVYVDTTGDTPTAMGGSTPGQTPPGTPLFAAVQPRGTRREDRQLPGGGSEPRSVQKCDVLFPTDPGVSQGNTIFWGSQPRVLNVIGPANDQSGQGICFLVECEIVG